MIEAFKMNTLELARHHRKHCGGEDGEHCTVSLNTLRMMAQKCGVVFSKEEMEEFA